ncbi:MAG: tetratricopeptide repeat protein, partial [Acidobacteria bacterium]|nr:tetratricopeptide repeat protein [Acidobacteriota bacterium]
MGYNIEFGVLIFAIFYGQKRWYFASSNMACFLLAAICGRETGDLLHEATMKKYIRSVNAVLGAGVISAMLVGVVPVRGQELVSVGGITEGSSVFVFRTRSKASPRKYVSRTGSARTKSQRTETARKLNKQYIALAKVNPRRQRTAAVDPKDTRLTKIKTMAPEQAAKLFAGVGEYYMDRDDFNNAVDFFREAANLDKTYVVARNGLSEALALKGNEELVRDARGPARAFFEEALKYNPNNAPAHYGLGEIFSVEEKETDARASYEKALANDSELTEIYVPLGILYFRAGEIAKADELLTKALAISPNDAETQYFLGLIRYAQNRNEDALIALRKATSIDPAYA